MNGDCKDCIQVKNLEDKIRALWHVVGELKVGIKDIEKKLNDQIEKFEKRITDLEISSSVTDEKLDRIFTAMSSMEKNIEKIANSIEKMQNKDAKTYANLKYEIIKYVVIAGVAAVVAKLI